MKKLVMIEYVVNNNIKIFGIFIKKLFDNFKNNIIKY